MCEYLWAKIGCTILQGCGFAILRSVCWKGIKRCLYGPQENEKDIRKASIKVDFDPSIQIALLKV